MTNKHTVLQKKIISRNHLKINDETYFISNCSKLTLKKTPFFVNANFVPDAWLLYKLPVYEYTHKKCTDKRKRPFAKRPVEKTTSYRMHRMRVYVHVCTYMAIILQYDRWHNSIEISPAHRCFKSSQNHVLRIDKHDSVSKNRIERYTCNAYT